MTMNLFPAAPKIRGNAAELPLHERSRYRAAAAHARQRVEPAAPELIVAPCRIASKIGHQAQPRNALCSSEPVLTQTAAPMNGITPSPARITRQGEALATPPGLL